MQNEAGYSGREVAARNVAERTCSAIDKPGAVSSLRPFLPGSSVVEQVTVNHLVAGSIPARAAISNWCLN